DVALSDGFEDAIEWRNLPEQALTGEAGGFQTRWSADHLTVLVRSTVEPERIEFTYGEDELFYAPGVDGSLQGVTTEVDGEHRSAVHVPHSGIAVGATGVFDLRVVADGAVVGAWNSPGATGRLTYLEPLSYLEIPELDAPVIDGGTDPVWADAAIASTETTVEGSEEG